MDVAQFAAAAERLIDESDALDSSFGGALAQQLKSLNGEFTSKAAQRGIDGQVAERWLVDTTELAADLPIRGLDGSTDLSVRLASLSFVLSDAPNPLDMDAPQDLLADAS